MTAGSAAQTGPGRPDEEDKHRLTTLSGLAALSLDALSSVAYGPEAIVLVLVAAGTVGLAYTLPVTLAIVVLLAVLVISYRQVIAAFPAGGGAYAVAKMHLGRSASLLAAASLIVDYVLNAAVGVSAGVAALTSAFPALFSATVPICLGVLALITAVNLWGVGESARLFIAPTLAFIAAIAAVIIGGLVRSHPTVPLHHDPRGPARNAVAADSAQPAGIRARSSHPEGHRQRGDLPSAFPAHHLDRIGTGSSAEAAARLSCRGAT